MDQPLFVVPSRCDRQSAGGGEPCRFSSAVAPPPCSNRTPPRMGAVGPYSPLYEGHTLTGAREWRDRDNSPAGVKRTRRTGPFAMAWTGDMLASGRRRQPRRRCRHRLAHPRPGYHGVHAHHRPGRSVPGADPVHMRKPGDAAYCCPLASYPVNACESGDRPAADYAPWRTTMKPAIAPSLPGPE
jgi:hypothetical protein